MSIEMTPTGKENGLDKKDDGVVNDAYVNDADDAEHGNKVTVEDEDEDDSGGNACSRGVGAVQGAVSSVFKKFSRPFWICFGLLILCGYTAYFGYAMYYEFGDEGSYRLLGFTIFGCVIFVWTLVGGYVGRIFKSIGRRSTSYHGQHRCFVASKAVRWFLYIGMLVFIGVYTGVVIGRAHPRNLISLGGIASFVLVMYITSINPARVNWHPVFWGMAMQYTFACIILETQWGYDIFQWLGNRMTEVLSYSNAGAEFVFGAKYTDHVFAFKVLPVIIYFSSLISVLYYLGVMQSVIKVLGKFLAFCLDTTATESLNAAGNIFAGQTESPLMIRPFLPVLTNSEMHAVMTGGFATVSGSILGAYVAYGVKANHLLAASVMSAPAALAISKLTYPETRKTHVDPKDVYKHQMAKNNNAIEAASEGASVAISLVANVAVNVMAFMALLKLINASLIFLGDRVGLDNFTFEFICSYVFFPISYLMGVEVRDCRRVAKLLGFKTFTNEFVAYIEMGKLIENDKIFQNYTSSVSDPTWTTNGDDIFLEKWGKTLIGGTLLERSQVIATYALCGFSNLGSMGIQIGALGAMAPNRKSDITKLALRAMIAGNIACFMTACISGLFYSGEGGRL